jgi:hypothetical protein
MIMEVDVRATGCIFPNEVPDLARKMEKRRLDFITLGTVTA